MGVGPPGARPRRRAASESGQEQASHERAHQPDHEEANDPDARIRGGRPHAEMERQPQPEHNQRLPVAVAQDAQPEPADHAGHDDSPTGRPEGALVGISLGESAVPIGGFRPPAGDQQGNDGEDGAADAEDEGALPPSAEQAAATGLPYRHVLSPQVTMTAVMIAANPRMKAPIFTAAAMFPSAISAL